MALHILRITPHGVTVEWLGGENKDYWVKKVFAVSPAELRFYAAELIFQGLQFDGAKHLENLESWDFEAQGMLAQAIMVARHSRILSRRAKVQWYWQWLIQFFQKVNGGFIEKEIGSRDEKKGYGLLTNEQGAVVGCYASDGTEKFCGQTGCTVVSGTCAASGPSRYSSYQ